MAGGELTTLSRAGPNTNSLRTTVPASIIKQFDLEDGDKIRWEFSIHNDQIVVIIRPEKSRSSY